MKILIQLIFLTWVAFAFAQQNNDGTISGTTVGPNFLVNGDFERSETLGTTKVNAAATRVNNLTSSDFKMGGKFRLRITQNTSAASSLSLDVDFGKLNDGYTRTNKFCRVAFNYAADAVGTGDWKAHFGPNAATASSEVFDLVPTYSSLVGGTYGLSSLLSQGFPCSKLTTDKFWVYKGAAGSRPIDIDDAYVWYTIDPRTWIPNQPQFLGSIKTAAAANCVWGLTTVTSFTNFPADTDCPVPAVTGSIVAPATKIPGFVLNTTKAGRYQFIANGAFHVTGGNGTNHGFRFTNGTVNSTPSPLWETSSGGLAKGSVLGEFTLPGSNSPTTIQFQGLSQGSDSVSINVTANDFEISVYYFPPEGYQQVLTLQEMDYGPRSYTPTLVGFGTVSNMECSEAREGIYNIIDCKWTSTGPTGVEARLPLPYGRVSSATGTIKVVGFGLNSSTAANNPRNYYPLIEAGSSYLTFGIDYYGGTVGGLTKVNGNYFTVPMTYSITARVPIQGWGATTAPPIAGLVGVNDLSNSYTMYAGTITCGSASVINNPVPRTGGATIANSTGSDNDRVCAVSFPKPFSSGVTCTSGKVSTASGSSREVSLQNESTTGFQVRCVSGGGNCQAAGQFQASFNCVGN